MCNPPIRHGFQGKEWEEHGKQHLNCRAGVILVASAAGGTFLVVWYLAAGGPGRRTCRPVCKNQLKQALDWLTCTGKLHLEGGSDHPWKSANPAIHDPWDEHHPRASKHQIRN